MGQRTMPAELVLEPGKEFFTRGELGKAVGHHKQTVWRWERDGKITPAKMRPLGLNSRLMVRLYSREQVVELWAKLTGVDTGAA